jgi:hypothetical protein
MDEIILRLLVIIGACVVTYYICKFAIELLDILMKEGNHNEVD